MSMHIGYEDVAPWPVKRIEKLKNRAANTQPKPILKSLVEQGVVLIDGETQISGIPPEAWDYQLGNRSAIDWLLDQYKEKKCGIRPYQPNLIHTLLPVIRKK